jgi:hypothetical protein
VSRGKNLTRENPVSEQTAIAAMAAYPDINDAKDYLERESGFCEVSVARLEQIKSYKAADLEEARRELAPLHESKLTNDMLDEARRVTSVIDLAVRRTERLLERDAVSDPAKAARDLGQLRTQSIDKRLALEGRPTAIIEKRSAEEILSKLEALGIAKRVDVTVEED